MKKRQLITSAFAVVLALTMVLTIYTRVKAFGPPNACFDSGAPTAFYEDDIRIIAYCTFCDNVGAPYEIEVGETTYIMQGRGPRTDMYYIRTCHRTTANKACAGDVPNPNYEAPTPENCHDEIIGYGTGTGGTGTN